MKNTILLQWKPLYLILTAFMLASCSGGGGGGGGSIATPSPSAPNINIQSTAYQDKLYSVDVSNISGLTSLTVTTGPSWLSYNSSTKKLEGVPTSPATNVALTLTAVVNGSSSTLGPYTITVLGDPLKQYQWHLKNSGQNNFATNIGTSGVDLNLSQATLDGITGVGVKVAVSDSGVEILHEDLSPNIISGASRNYNLSSPYVGDPTPTSTTDGGVGHGTAVAGIIGAKGWNSKGGRGVAPDAQLAGFLFIGATPSDAKKINQANGSFDIFNYSYGGDPISPSSVNSSYVAQLMYGVSSLRSSKGAIYIKSAGNEFEHQFNYDATGGQIPECFNVGSGSNGICYVFGNSNLSDADNTQPYIIVTGAINAKGQRSSYSSPGSNLWIAATGGEYGNDDPAIMTTDIQGCNKGLSSTLVTPQNSFENSSTLNPNCKYTSTMNGTSSAAPSLSGVVALLLQANPNLTWRDVKYILAATAIKNDPTAGITTHPGNLNLSGHTYQQGWNQNAAGFWFHNWYGFGQVNADAAIAMAKTYSGTLGTFRETKAADSSWIYSSGIINQAIPDNSAVGTTSTINVKHSYIIEGVQIKFTTTNNYLTDLGVELTSPSGTKSILLNINSGSVKNSSLGYDALMLSNAFLGENSSGNWTLKVIDGASGGTGNLTNWQINIFGHSSEAIAPNPPTSLVHNASYNSNNSTPPVSFTASNSTDVIRYEYAVGTSAGGTQIKSWTSIGLSTSFTGTGFSVNNGSSYFINVRAIDSSENISTVTTSSWTVDTTAPVSPNITDPLYLSATSTTSGTLTGTCEPNTTVSIPSTQNITITAATCNSSGVLTISYIIVGGTGKKLFSYTLTDQAGNTTASSFGGLVYVDPYHEVFALGDSHGCSITTSGTVRCWGNNDKGQLGNGTTNTANTPVTVSSLTNAISIGAGSYNSCAALSDGTVKCWGDNTYGQLGNNSTASATTATLVSGISTATHVVVGTYHACALLSTGTVKCWGYNADGELGNGTTTQSLVPVDVTSLSSVTKLSSSRGMHTCALLSNGTVKCWGYNATGALGNGTTTNAITPTLVTGISGATDISVSSFGACATTPSGTKCWGGNSFYQVGDNTTTQRTSPVAVTTASSFKQISIGDLSSCILTTGGKVQCWGSSVNNLTDDISTSSSPSSTLKDISSLTTDVVQVKTGFTFSCALKNTGQLYCWGKQSNGELGTGLAVGNGDRNITKYSSLLTNHSTVVTGENHACSIRTDGTVWCVGSNGSGQLGLGTSYYGYSEVGYDRFKEISSLAGIAAQITAGSEHTCIRTTSGGVKCWGDNYYGQIGVGSTSSKILTPTDVSLGGTAVDISAGRYHTCAVLSNGTIKCWGSGSYGRLGNNNTADSNVPVTVNGISTANSVSAGGFHTCSKLSDTTLKCWGDNTYGQLGNNSTTQSAVPVSVSSLTNVTSISIGRNHSCAVNSSGAAYCWGLNTNGQLGNNDTTGVNRLTPVSVYNLTSGVQQISAGLYHTCALQSNAVKCWGSNYYGQVGGGSVDLSYADPVPTSQTADYISTGGNYSCSISSSDALTCWGFRLNGQFGNGTTFGTTTLSATPILF